MHLARTTGGRLNDYVTTTPLLLSENNNQALGRIVQPSEIKGSETVREGEVEADFYGYRQGL